MCRFSAGDSGSVDPEDPSARSAERLGALRTDPAGGAVSRTSPCRTSRIQAKWGISADIWSAKYCELMPTGREQLEDESTLWRKLSAAAESTLDMA